MTGTLAAAGCGLASYHAGGWLSPLLAGILGVLVGGLFKYLFTRRLLTSIETLQDILIPAILTASANAGVQIWQVPVTWKDLLALTELASALSCIVYLSALIYGLSAKGRHPGPLSGGSILLVPYLFNGLLLVGAPGLLGQMGGVLIPGNGAPSWISVSVGRAVALSFFNEVVAAGIGLVLTRQWIGDGRVHALLIGSAAVVSVTPEIASWGSGPFVAHLPAFFGIPVALVAAMLSLAGLWSQTFLATGMFMDAFRGRRPTWHWCAEHYRSGFAKGAVYTLVFMSIVLIVGIVVQIKGVPSFILSHVLGVSLLGGAVVFPLLGTIVETFDGSERFFRRVWLNYLQPASYLRGGVIGAFSGIALTHGLQGLSNFERFCLGFGAGAVAYSGVDLMLDAFELMRGKRLRLQSWRVYALASLLGGGAGGALAWYFDAAQIHVVVSKFSEYAALHYPHSGILVKDYVIYPLCSKWGAMNLGRTEGGIRLLYNEALSGVINWSLAAPLFSVNLVVLTALLQRSAKPLKELFTREGVVGLLEQAVRVQRWGLWMAPVIYSFLRLSPDPTWYNQDGAMRTVVATVKAWSLDPQGFRTWSLTTFLNILVYDWFRILIWLDHMGLRVATLVNLSFVGADLVDERAARAIGHSVRTRCIPEGLRRFATWAPLLIPFYLPRGAEWDYVWNHSVVLRKELLQSFWPPVLYVVGVFLVVASFIGVFRALKRSRAAMRASSSSKARNIAGDAPYQEKRYAICNGVYTVDVTSDGRGFSKVFSAVRKGKEMDITRRPDDCLQMRGKFFYLRDMDREEDSPQRLWSIGPSPVKREGGEYTIIQTAPLSLRIGGTYAGIQAEAEVSVHPRDSVETWKVRLRNLENRPRWIDLISYQEFCLNVPDAYRRHPSFNYLHMGTRFVRPMNAIVVANRLLKSAERDPAVQRMSGETAFHAVKEDPTAGIILTGYEDSRTHFIGKETLKSPAALAGDMRLPEDEGLLYSFDPIGSLRLQVHLAPKGHAEVTFLDGYAREEKEAIKLIRCHLGLRQAGDPRSWEAFTRKRSIHVARRGEGSGVGGKKNAGSFYEFSEDGDELRVTWDTPRPWAHVMANEMGYGTLLTNDGSIYSFMKNSQQNGLSPFDVDSIPTQAPGQVLYLQNLATGEVDSPTYVPFRKKDGAQHVVFGKGYAVFRATRGEMDFEIKLFVLPDQPAEVRLLKIRNRGTQPLVYRVVPYAQIMLGEVPSDTCFKLAARWDKDLRALFFSNPMNDYHRGWAFASTNLPVEAFETVRRRFLGGPDRDLTHPFMVEHGAPDPDQPDDGVRIACFVSTLSVPPGGEATMTMVLGQTTTMEEAAKIITFFKEASRAEEVFERTKKWWSDFLSVLQVKTNAPAFDRMINSWLVYQVLVARLWGRLGPDQRGGGYGYRDQLQDVLPFVYLHPGIAREQILLHAAQQFREGDVMQWWHASWEGKTGIGVRSWASDPHLWLPYLVCHYVKATGDFSILDETLPFLEGERLFRRSEGHMFAPRQSRDKATLYTHCLRAMDITLNRTGRNRLPLLGTGDWNDSLDRAGFKGAGESVWLGFFLYHVLKNFSPLVEIREGAGRKEHYLQEAAFLRRALDAMRRKDSYVRAITDDGHEMIRPNSLVSSWPTISGAVDFETECEVMAKALEELEKEKMVLLFTPPYTESDPVYPGRLADYPPGVRENGGQYSHGVSWLVDALIVLAEKAQERGEAERANRYRSKAVELWYKISPLSHLDSGDMAVYGLPPHQQAADVYCGEGYEGRGGWSWYTGAAARMLYTGYRLLGLEMRGGRLFQRSDPPYAGTPLKLTRVSYKHDHEGHGWVQI